MFVFNQWVLKIITSTLRTNMNPPLIDDIQFTSSPASFFATFSKADLEKKKGFEKIAVGSLVDDKIKICFPFTRHIHRHSLLLTLLTYFISKNLTCASQQRAAFKDDVPSHWSFQSCCPRHYPELVMCLHWARAIGIFFLIIVLVANSCQILLQLYPARLLCQWDFPGKNTGVGCHFLLHGPSFFKVNSRYDSTVQFIVWEILMILWEGPILTWEEVGERWVVPFPWRPVGWPPTEDSSRKCGDRFTSPQA